jgi:hypothetical protein
MKRGVLIGALVAVLVLAVGGGVGWLIRGQDSDPVPEADAGPMAGGGPQASATDISASPSASLPTSPAPPTTNTVTLTSEQAALAELNALRAKSLQSLVLDERWVAQLASKSVGIIDPLQTARNGTHTFYAVDILAESNAARATVSDSSTVLVLTSTDFGRYSTAPDGQPYWVTLVDGGFGSSDAVKAWCASTYPTLDATSLANACAARTLSPPHS